MHTLVFIFICELIKWKDNKRNATYVQDDVGFFTINFYQKLPLSFEPFIFPCQATQVFFSNDIKRPSWKVVLRKEACSRKEVANIKKLFITTTMETSGLSVLEGLPPPPTIILLIGAIDLFEKDNLLFVSKILRLLITLDVRIYIFVYILHVIKLMFSDIVFIFHFYMYFHIKVHKHLISIVHHFKLKFWLQYWPYYGQWHF